MNHNELKSIERPFSLGVQAMDRIWPCSQLSACEAQLAPSAMAKRTVTKCRAPDFRHFWTNGDFAISRSLLWIVALNTFQTSRNFGTWHVGTFPVGYSWIFPIIQLQELEAVQKAQGLSSGWACWVERQLSLNNRSVLRVVKLSYYPLLEPYWTCLNPTWIRFKLVGYV